jgi:hypothetical protein
MEVAPQLLISLTMSKAVPQYTYGGAGGEQV